MRKSYYHTTLNLTDEDINHKIQIEKKTDTKISYVGIFRTGLKQLMKKYGIKNGD